MKLDECNFVVTWEPEDRAFVARVAEFPSLAAHGNTSEAALFELRLLLADVLLDLDATGESNKNLVERLRRIYAGEDVAPLDLPPPGPTPDEDLAGYIEDGSQEVRGLSEEILTLRAKVARYRAALAAVRECMGGVQGDTWNCPEDVWGICTKALGDAAIEGEVEPEEKS